MRTVRCSGRRGGVCPGGVSAQEGCVCPGCVCVCPSMLWGKPPPPPRGQNSWHTLVKILRCGRQKFQRLHMSDFAYGCKMRYPLNLVLENKISLILLNFLHCNFRLWFKTPQPFDSYPCHASEMTRNTLNHCLKFTVRSIFCHICYGKISEKNVNTFFKVKLFVSKTSDSCFKVLISFKCS